jgi:phosphoglycolate phosphatase
MPLCYRRYNVKYNYCIWDFNGTILDDVELGIYSINELFKAHNMDKRLAYDEYRANFDFPIKDSGYIQE